MNEKNIRQRPRKSEKQEKLLPSTNEQLLKMIADMQKELSRQRDLINQVISENQLYREKLSKLETEPKPAEYPSTSTWISKIVFILREQNRPLRSAVLISLLGKREKSLARHHNKVQYFSAFLSNAVKHGRIIQQKLGGVRGYYYLLPQWLDEKKKVKLEYEKMMI